MSLSHNELNYRAVAWGGAKDAGGTRAAPSLTVFLPSIPQNRRAPPDTWSYLDCLGRLHDGAGTKLFLIFYPLLMLIYGQGSHG
ncbi:hypothetical protein T4D_3899 [Trichinella pseudospiralis]|uniref:Uncharacterized protein n=1 Tax=Trichinella pseudospiralis TaxID=6337 RepID=A0A0V1FBA0_TRIPS|nr:hypothetical protein T4D_3899 [Trichinella pseudospiralis]